MNNIGLHVWDDSAVALQLGDEYHVIELERFFGERHYNLHRSARQGTRRHIAESIQSIYGYHEFDNAAVVAGRVVDVDNESLKWAGAGSLHVEADLWSQYWHVRQWKLSRHHFAHAAAAFYQSPFRRALVVSCDEGGDDGYFRFFTADFDQGLQEYGPGVQMNLASAYSALSSPLAEGRTPPRITLLAAYGEVVPKWKAPISDFMRGIEYTRARQAELPYLGKRLGLNFEKKLNGQLGRDYAATVQECFEELFIAAAAPVARGLSLPVVLTGVCALNAAANEHFWREVHLPVFVPPNPDDAGLALGSILQYHPPRRRINVTYAGLPLLNASRFHRIARETGAMAIDAKGVASNLRSGYILGIARGSSEHGSRGLGNRSILADPGDWRARDRLNLSIKFREPFRPYAAVVRLQDVHKYFEAGDYDMSFGSFKSKVRREWHERIPAVVHIDGTARVQTVTEQQNRWLYDVLTEFERQVGYGVLLNASLSVMGRPLITRLDEAMSMLKETDLDAIVIADYLFFKGALNEVS